VELIFEETQQGTKKLMPKDASMSAPDEDTTQTHIKVHIRISTTQHEQINPQMVNILTWKRQIFFL